MDWTASVDIYCERVDPSFWAEPINAVSNLAFIIAAILAAITARTHAVTDLSVWVLIGLAFAIGAGSTLFHTYAQAWAGFADVLPIILFVIGYALVAMAKIAQMSPAGVALGGVSLLAFFAVIVVMTEPLIGATGLVPMDLNGSEQYVPALAAMLVFTATALWHRHAVRYWFLSATVIFAVSLGFRTIDMSVCANWPYGSHFMWHILNGLMIGLLLQALIRTIYKGRPPHEQS